jgi:hypothetical protein
MISSQLNPTLMIPMEDEDQEWTSSVTWSRKTGVAQTKQKMRFLA